MDKLSYSFRDPDAFVYKSDGVVLRQLNHSYLKDYESLMNTGLYQTLVDRRQLVSHEEVDVEEACFPEQAAKVIKPTLIPFISKPWEWTFFELKQAAILTLDIAMESLKKGMILKDASACNIQFIGNAPIFIDTGSFETFKQKPWIAYNQFCKHFLAPLALMQYVSPHTIHIMKHYIDGVPLEMAVKALPIRARFRLGLLLHLYLHARYIQKSADEENSSDTHYSAKKLMDLLTHLKDTINGIQPPANEGVWSHYESMPVYKSDDFSKKKDCVAEFIQEVSPQTTWDMGCNTGIFSRIASQNSHYVIATDSDHYALEKCHTLNQKEQINNILTLDIDFLNPTSASGLLGEEHESFLQRIKKCDAVLVLGFVHHACVSMNVPLPRMAKFISEHAKNALVEFVSPEDPFASRILKRKPISHPYNEDIFMRSFSEYFSLVRKEALSSTRNLYYFKNL